MTARLKYTIITPVRDEEKYIQEALRSVVSQSVPPLQWIIVNDRSKDNTGTAARHSGPADDWEFAEWRVAGQ